MQCPNYFTDSLQTNKFCPGCGQKLEIQEQSSIESDFEGARKHATILFSDLSGYTAMTEKMDPEDVKIIMEGIFEKAGKGLQVIQSILQKPLIFLKKSVPMRF